MDDIFVLFNPWHKGTGMVFVCIRILYYSFNVKHIVWLQNNRSKDIYIFISFQRKEGRRNRDKREGERERERESTQ